MLRELGIYLLGGVTFLPLCLLAAYLFLPDVREAYGLPACLLYTSDAADE